MPKRFVALVLGSLGWMTATYFTVIGVVLMAVTWFLPGDKTIGSRWVMIIAGLLLYCSVSGWRAAWIAYNSGQSRLPTIRYATDPPKRYADAVALLLMDPSDLFSHDSLVSIYHVDKDMEMERLVGLGRVLLVQEDGKIQVLVIRDIDFADGWNDIRKNDATKLRCLLVKAALTQTALEGVLI